MHRNSIEHMRALVGRYLDRDAKLLIGDVGSFDYTGSYRALMQSPNWTYQGVDLNEAVRRYAAGCPRCQSLPCTCA